MRLLKPLGLGGPTGKRGVAWANHIVVPTLTALPTSGLRSGDETYKSYPGLSGGLRLDTEGLDIGGQVDWVPIMSSVLPTYYLPLPSISRKFTAFPLTCDQRTGYIVGTT
ncbi:hypothetical protein NEUTE2DRAFT_48675 [Neurospora tetrasperma FGSC 2509]|nr:hypothetical protein NEUTE2DRAFT_48675 [Neurospora tetrasperma FGSC 2509]